MSGALLKMFENIQGLNYGTRFFKADLHFHTPASEDARGSNRYSFNPYNNKEFPYPQRAGNPDYKKEVMEVQNRILERARSVASKIVETFLEKELSIVAVTDHNGIGTIWSDCESEDGLMDLAAPTWYELIDDAAQNVNDRLGHTELLVLPGVEISTTGVHILAIFPPQSPRRKVHFMICDLLNEVGFEVEDWGKNPMVGKASVIDAIELITKKGGLAIPAHVDGSDQALLSLHELSSGAMKNVLQNKYLRAVEIVDPGKFNRPDKETKLTLKATLDDLRRANGLPSLAYFQGSDAHDLATIAKRFTYLKMTEPSFSGVQTAIKMPSSRVRIAESHKEVNGLYIHAMVCDHPGLGHQTLRFNRNLNCISGKRGAGKTSLFDLMQGVVDPQFPKMDGTAVLFVEQITEGVSKYYAYARNAEQNNVSIFALDTTAETVTELDLAQAKALALQPRFYNATRMQQIIDSKEELRDFLCNNFDVLNAVLHMELDTELRRKNEQSIAEFNDLFSTPAFLSAGRDPLLELTLDGNNTYQLTMNMQWRTGKPSMKDFFRLTPGQRRTAMMCMIIMSGRFGPVIFDAPEQEFDNEDMAKYFVPVIQEHKDALQIMLFTNHPILAVNTDPDNYLLMQLQDAKLRDIVSGFAIDAGMQRSHLLNILEGNIETFRRRATRYE